MYTGLLHLGIPDGAFLQWAKGNKEEIDSEVGVTLWSTLIIEGVLWSVVFPILYFFFAFNHTILFLGITVACYGIVINMCSVYIFRHQGLRLFKRLTRITLGTRVLFFAMLVVMLALDHMSYELVIGAYCLSAVGQLALLAMPSWAIMNENLPKISTMLAFCHKYIKGGMILLFINFVPILFSTADRLFVTSLFSTHDFAMYSFAASLITLVYVLIRSVANVLFPYIAKADELQRRKVYRLSRIVLIASWGSLLTIYLIVPVLVRAFIPNYDSSISQMHILVLGLGFVSIIQIVHSAYYKVNLFLLRFLVVGFIMTGILAGMIAISVVTFRNLDMVAASTSIASMVWFVVNELVLAKSMNEKLISIVKLLVFASLVATIFVLVTVHFDRVPMQLVVYLASFILLTWTMFGKDLKEVFVMVKP
jgi:O-antigen/teichoic acid export membrane protein